MKHTRSGLCLRRAESVPPAPHRPVADSDAALVQQVLDVAELRGEPDVLRYGQADDLGRGLEVPEWAASGHHHARLGDRSARPTQSSSDTAPNRYRGPMSTGCGARAKTLS